MNMLRIIIFSFSFLVSVYGNNERALLKDLEGNAIYSQQDTEANDISEVKQPKNDRGFSKYDAKSDFIDTLLSIPGIFTSGDARRWATLNAAYQVVCYRGKTSNLITESWWVYNKYYGYGCYCGAGDYYGNYRDATDLCCKGHDECYTEILEKYDLPVGCATYTTPYSVSCCKKDRITKCTDSGPSASRALCDCDQALAKCLAQSQVVNTYNKAFLNDRSQCNDVSTETRDYTDIIKSCQDVLTSPRTFPITYGSQGSCPS